MNDLTLRITEIFYSLQGEARTVGCPTVFIRLTGCPLRCGYCDTAYAFTGGEVKTINDVLALVDSYQPHYITVTGGEPLAQKNCLHLLTALCDKGYDVSLETSGALDVSDVDARVNKVMDLKTPSSGEMQRNHYENMMHLLPHDQVKFVIGDRTDYEWAKDQVEKYQLVGKVSDILFSPIYKQIEPQALAQWILDDHLPVRLQMQMHKLIWGDSPGH
jgi:7-carboxy-7-deazaguanine synthase